MSAFGLIDQHESAIVNYMRFSRYQKSIKLKSICRSFQDILSARLSEDTYTRDEFKEIITDLMDIIKTDVDQELMNTSHMNALLLVQLFQQAEKWHLKLQADISELENRELLEQMRSFEEKEFHLSKESDQKFITKLEPITDSGSSLLNMEIERLNQEKTRLNDKVRNIEAEARNYNKENQELKQSLEKIEEELNEYKNKFSKNDSSKEVEELRGQILELQLNIEKNSLKNNDHSELSSAKHELLKVKEMLELAEKELEKKVQQTVPFQNLKMMVQKKTDQIKDLRKKLSKYESIEE